MYSYVSKYRTTHKHKKLLNVLQVNLKVHLLHFYNNYNWGRKHLKAKEKCLNQIKCFESGLEEILYKF